MVGYDDATSYCTTMDGYVISINDAGEQNFAYRMQSRHLNIPYWVGLSDKVYTCLLLGGTERQGIHMFTTGWD